MVQPRRRPRLAAEALQAGRVAGDGQGQHLESDASSQGLLLGLVDDAHAAPADLAQDAVIPQALQRRPRGMEP